jgi:hypothetical protein
MHTLMIHDAQLDRVFAALRVGHANNSLDTLILRQSAAFMNIYNEF